MHSPTSWLLLLRSSWSLLQYLIQNRTFDKLAIGSDAFSHHCVTASRIITWPTIALDQVSVCRHIRMSIYTWVYCVQAYMHEYAWVYIHEYTVCRHICMSMHEYIYMSILCAGIYAWVCSARCMHAHVCLYICMYSIFYPCIQQLLFYHSYIELHQYIYIYIYIYIAQCMLSIHWCMLLNNVCYSMHAILTI